MKKLLPIIFLLLCDCAYYSFSGSTLPSHLKTIAIPVFSDRTAEFGVSDDLTNALINEFTKDNTLKISDPRVADSILEGTIQNIRDEVGTYTATEQVTDIKVHIRVTVKYSDIKKKKTIWEEELTQWGTYTPGDPNSRSAGINEAINKLVADILNKTIAGW